jgi:hypothetical protein
MNAAIPATSGVHEEDLPTNAFVSSPASSATSNSGLYQKSYDGQQ